MGYGDFSKPLRPPPGYQVWDRSSGRRMARVHDVLRRGRRLPRTEPRPADRAPALARLRARYTPWALRSRRAVGLAVLAASAAVAVAMWQSPAAVDPTTDPSGYAALVGALVDVCPTRTCAFGRREGQHAVRAAMDRLRVHHVTYDAGVAEARAWSWMWDHPLLYVSPSPTPRQRYTRGLRLAWEQSLDGYTPPVYEALGGGWYRPAP